MQPTAFEQDRADLVMGERFLLTLHRSAPHFLRETHRHYRSDFLRFAKSSSFLLYEIWDHLIDDYLEVQKEFEERVEKVQIGLTTDIDEKEELRTMLEQVSALHGGPTDRQERFVGTLMRRIREAA